MTYATQQDLIDRFGDTELLQLTDREGTGAINATVVTRALTDADAEIDAWLSVRYALPLAAVPAILNTYAQDIARYRLYDDKATEQVSKRYDDALKFLKAASTGSVQLGANTPTITVSPVGSPAYSANDRTFSKDTLEDY